MLLATERFGPETVRCLSRLLADITEPDRMDCVATAVFDYYDDDEFLARVGELIENGQS